MALSELAHLLPGEIASVVGTPAFGRAGPYARDRVLSLHWDPTHLTLLGKVVGRGALYVTEAWFLVDRTGNLRLDVGGCSCPVQVNCKHVAAVVLAGAGLERSTARVSRAVGAEVVGAEVVGAEVVGTEVAALPAGRHRPDVDRWDVEDDEDSEDTEVYWDTNDDGGGRDDWDSQDDWEGRNYRDNPDDWPPGNLRPEPVATWDHELLTLVQTAPDTDPAAVPLGIEVGIEPVPGRPELRLTGKIVRPGRAGWVNGSLDWGRLDSWHLQRSNHPDAHIRVLREIFAVYSARTSHAGHGYGYYGTATKVLDLGEVGPRLWPLLHEARRVGIRLLHAAPHLGLIAEHDEAELTLDVTGHGEEGAMLTPRLLVDGHEVGAGTVTFLGTEGHGVVHVDRADTGDDPSGWRIKLARLADPPSPQLRRLFESNRPLAIPAGEEARFATELWPRLRHVTTITSSDGSFTPPAISPPRLALHAEFGPQHTTRLDWAWTYDVGGQERRTGLDADPAEGGFRDLAAEQEVFATLDVDLEPFDLLGVDGQPRPTTHLEGMQTARIAADLLPGLAGHPHVIVEVDGTPADFREVGDSVVIGVSTAEVAGQTDWFDLGVTITAASQDVPFTEVFRALAAGDTHLLLDDGAYFSLDKPELQSLARLIEEARALQDSSSGPLRLSPFQADLWAELAALGVVTRQAAAWQRQVDALLSPDPITFAAVPDGIAATLRPYQTEGFGWLSFLWQHDLGGILADDMGLGKTVQALAMIVHARVQQPGGAPFLVLAPTSVVSNWATEAARFAPGLSVVTVDSTLKRAGTDIAEVVAGADVVVTSYTRFRLDSEAYGSTDWAGLLLDEAQMVKNHRAKLYGCVRRLMTPFKLAITGTPMENNLMELWSLLSITAPGLFPDPKRFEAYYARPIERHGDAERLAQLRRRIRPLMTRRTKEQVAGDLPPKQEQVLDVELHPRHARIYATQLQRERQRVLGLLDDFDRNRVMILRSLTLLRQLSLHAGLVDPDHAEVACAKLDVLVDHLGEVVDGGHRALVFSQFTGFLAHVRARLDAEGIEYCYLDGRTRKRDEVLRRFKEGAAPVFLISLKAGGFGLNLTEADYCFLLDPWWNPATEAQAIDRTHRIGQTRTVMVYRLIAKDTIEEKVLALAQRKAELFGGVMADGEVFGGTLTRADVHALFE